MCTSIAEETVSPSRQELLEGMRRAMAFYVDEVSTHGGYVYYYALDLERRWGEGEATADQIWVQPPGSPTVGMAFLKAYQATGDADFLEAATRAGEALLYGQPPAITSRESQDVMKALLLIHQETGEPRFLEPIPTAIDYFRHSLLEDGRLARFYELETNRPLYMEREGRVYTLTYDDDDFPSHYGWKVGSRLDEIERQWKRQKSGDLSVPRSGSKRSPREILNSLDEEGRWISTVPAGRLTGQPPFQPGERYISSAVFSENLSTLADAMAELEK